MKELEYFFYYLHVIFCFLVIAISFLPIKLLKTGLFLVPLLLTLLWLTYNKCPMNQLHQIDNGKKYHFFQECLSPFFPTITIRKCHQLATFITCFIPTFIVFRLLYLS